MNSIIIAQWEVQIEHLDNVLMLIAELQKQTLQEKGNVNYHIFQSVKEPNKFTLIEDYMSEDAFSQHLQSEHYQQIAVQKIQPCLAVRNGDLYHQL